MSASDVRGRTDELTSWLQETYLVAHIVTLAVVFFPFGHKRWEGGRDLQMIFCLSVSAV